MTKKATCAGEIPALRRQAETFARKKVQQLPQDIEDLSLEEIHHLFHELQVHQIELEMQNENLKQMQAELEASQEEYFDLYDLAPVGYLTLTDLGLITKANATAAEILGVTKDTLVNRMLSSFIWPADVDIYYLNCKNLFASVKKQVFEIRTVRGGGNYIRTRMEATALRDGAGKPLCRLIMSDITANKQAEEAVRESENRLRLALDAVRIGDWELDGKIESFLEMQLGRCVSIQGVICNIKKLASSDFSLIVEGETGTGKSLVANIIHNLSARAQGPFIVLDLSVLPENLVESELFGYEKGAFTGADKRKKGYFELADGGTMFIDELQNMSPFIQAKILKVVDEKEFYPVGSDHPVQSNMRIIGATNSCIRKAVQEKTFREDLYYRLNEASLRLPPLRDRRDDIGFFIRKFLLEVSSELYKPLRITDDRIFTFLTEQRWPGNVRELKNVIRRAALFSESNTLTLEDVSRAMTEMSVSSQPVELPCLQECFGPLSIPEAEKYAIRLALDHTCGNKTKAAGILQITLKTLLTKIKKYSL